MITQSRLWMTAGWTMLHFLWVGTCIAILAAVIRRTYKSASPHVKYGLNLAFFIALALSPVVMFSFMMKDSSHRRIPATAQAVTQTQSSSNCGLQAPIPLEFPVGSPKTQPYPQPIKAISPEKVAPSPHRPAQANYRGMLTSIAARAPWVWLIGFPLVFLLLSLGLIGVKNLRSRTETIEAGLVFELCRKLSSTVGLTRAVTVGVCDKVVTPILIGAFRPMILLPTSAVTGWSAEQLEMVLLHELAHVRRWDNLVNIAQRTVESLLFFHPAVWIISSWVRCERECSCDQIVLKHTGKPREYVAALVSLAQAHGVRTASVAMADRSLVSRVRRILQIEQPTSRYSSHTVSAFVLAVLAVVIGIGFTQLGASARPYMVKTDPAEGVILELEGAWPDGKLFDIADENTGFKTKVYAFDTAIPKYKLKTNRKISTSAMDINGFEIDVSQGYPSIKIDCLFTDRSNGERVGLVVYLYGRNSKLLGMQTLLEPDKPIVTSGYVQVDAVFPEVNLLDIQSYKLSLRGSETTVTIDSSPATIAATSARLQNTPAGKGNATFSTGMNVELVGISNTPQDDNSWWSPDGTPLSATLMRSFNRNSAIEVPRGAYAFAFKLGGNLERHDTAFVDVGQAARSQDVATYPIPETGELLKVQAAYPYADLRKTNLRFAIKTKVWVTHATCFGSNAAELLDNHNMYNFVAKPPVELHGDTILEVICRESNFRILAIDQSGTGHESDSSELIGSKGEDRTAILRFR